MFDRPGSMGNPLFAAGGDMQDGQLNFLAELQARAEAEAQQLQLDVQASRQKSRRFSQVHSVDASQVCKEQYSMI